MKGLTIAELARARLNARPSTTGFRRFDVYKDDPVAFAREVLGIEPWKRQIEILEAIRTDARVSCRSGHKVSKSNSIAIIALWFGCTRDQARVVLTAPTHRQIRAILWREIKSLYLNAKRPLGGNLHELPELGLQWEDGREVVGFYSNEPERMAGISGKNLLFIIDEASGIPHEIYEAIEGNRAGGAKLAMFSNPTQTSGAFFDSFHKARAYYRCIHISSEEAAETGIPGLATKEYVAEKRREWGVSHPLYQVRIAGNFPSQQTNAVISLADVERAVRDYDDTRDDGPLHVGVDAARFGDDASIIFPRRGQKALPFKKVTGLDTQQVGAHTMELVRRLRHSRHERVTVKVDSIGLGAGVADYLRAFHRTKEIHLVEVNVSAPAKDDKNYHNLRSEIWFRLAWWLRNGGVIPTDGELEAELVTPTYKFDLKNRQQVMSKDDIKSNLSWSPDKADALCLAVWEPPSGRFMSSRVRSRVA